MLVFLFRLLSALPLPALHVLGSGLGWLVYGLSPSYRRRLRANLARAGFSSHLHEAVAESGKAIVELPFIWCAAQERVNAVAEMENYALVQAALDRGHGIVFLTPHLGCFEITAQQVSLHTPLTVMYRPPRKAALKPLVEGARARGNMELAPANLSGVRVLAKKLKKGEPIGILPDQVPQEGEGVWAEFFGAPAYTMTLPAKLAQLGKSPIILTYAERLPQGRGFLIRFFEFDGDLSGTPAEQARAINRAMEQLIAKVPAQYFWSYNRYKSPEGVAGPEQSA
ncbi:lysophospholipid acyltransferase family protein [Massilia arenosa]|uniref:Lysophospholipid acyltransferase family protein n=1 Tax=Zemynaea arenosa TaxID=2561931 RepID=A0A4Y9S875_9BURK|nr:lysophospholipid acyltransferase family protein [Massilia arenosa]TFW16282.1 lysophospholipid acyltransferase family protein [Massilia arenosa]